MQLRLHPAESRIRKLSAEIPAQFIAFDILLWKGEKLHKLPLEKRRKELERKAKRFQLSPYSRDLADAERWLDRLEAAGLDGVVAKRLGAPYLPGSREGVVKVKKYKTGRLRDRRLPLQREGGGSDLDAPARALRQGRRARLRRALLGDEGAVAGRSRRSCRSCAKPGFLSDKRIPGGEPLVAGPGARLAPGEAQARRRGALRQARAQPLPARDEAHPVPARQGPEGLHVARGPAAPPPRRPDRRVTSWPA